MSWELSNNVVFVYSTVLHILMDHIISFQQSWEKIKAKELYNFSGHVTVGGIGQSWCFKSQCYRVGVDAFVEAATADSPPMNTLP